MFDDQDRDITTIQLPRWGRVGEAGGAVPWLVLDDSGATVAPIRQYLRDFAAQDNSAGSIRSYAFGPSPMNETTRY